MESPVKIEQIQGRGRALVSSRALKGGEIVLRDSPLLLYSAFPLHHPTSLLYCDYCFKKLQSTATSCPSCHHRFCSPNCLSNAANSSHSQWACQSLNRLRNCPALASHQSAETQIQARFLIAAVNLAAVSPPNFQILLSLEGRGGNEEIAAAQFLHSLISTLCAPPPIPGLPFSVELCTALISKDKLNAFGLMEPFNPNGERSVRAYGIYPKASLFNHDCLPNACRFDYVDSAVEFNTDVVIRMIHDVPEGREICLSYFPVNENYKSRQKRLLEDYGFVCECDRCKVEANWLEEEEIDGDDDEDEAMEDEEMEEMMEPEEKDDFPHAYFFVRYMCKREHCWGTLAPLPANQGSDLLECNVCGEISKVDDDEGCVAAESQV